MQIGADIYCDSECILRTLDGHLPSPAFYGQTPPLWNGHGLFELLFKLALVYTGDAMPEGFVEDRGRLYLGPDWDMDTLSSQIPGVIDSIENEFSALDQVLGEDRLFLGGEQPNAADANAYHLVWFLRGRWDGGPALLSKLTHVLDWEKRMTQIGHGTWTELSSGDALDIARNAEPTTPRSVESDNSLGLKIDQPVTVTPDGIGGDPEVAGTVRFIDHHTIAILRHDELVGDVCVHFPILGYRVRAQ